MFIRTDGDLDTVGILVAPLVGVDWVGYINGDGERSLAGTTDGAWLMLDKFAFEDTSEIAFWHYPFYLRVVRYEDAARIAIARGLFEKIKGLNVPLMLVDDLEIKLDEWNPPA